MLVGMSRFEYLKRGGADPSSLAKIPWKLAAALGSSLGMALQEGNITGTLNSNRYKPA
jgi:hypothetical protein